MKGRDEFSSEELDELRRLIREKQTADRDRQEVLRGRMRAIGFYITDYVIDQQGFTVSDFDELIESGRVKVRPDAKHDLEPSPKSTGAWAPPPSGALDRDNEARLARERRTESAQRFKPEKVDLLLVAEAPPKELDRYFYFEDVREQDSLFRYVCRAILEREPTRDGKPELLAELCNRGVFLIDLQDDPRDETPLTNFVAGLVERCRELDPNRIVLIKVTVFDVAYEALKEAGLPVSSVRVPFPGSGQQKRFLEAIGRALGRTEPT